MDQRDENGADGGEHGQYRELLGAGIHKEHSFSDAGFRCAPCNGKHPKGINVFQVLKTWERCAFLNTSSSIQTSHPMGCVTVGPGVPPGRPLGREARGLYRRSGISPCPEDICDSVVFNFYYTHGPQKSKSKIKKVCAQMFDKTLTCPFGYTTISKKREGEGHGQSHHLLLYRAPAQ